jgi:UTP--glucose-1-phosphate uridylyltransferase
LKEVRDVANLANFVYVRQKGPYGNGTPLINVEHLIGDEPFIYTWSDDFIKSDPLRFQQMINAYEEFGCAVMSAVKADKDEDYRRYGYAAGDAIREGVIDIRTIIEKPGPQKAPSDLATVSGCLLTPEIFAYLHQAEADRREDKELYYNDAIKLMVNNGGRAIALEVSNGRYYDAGNKLEYLKTVVDFALKHDDISDDFREYLRSLLDTSQDNVY